MKKSHRKRNALLGVIFTVAFLISIATAINSPISNANSTSSATQPKAPISPCVFSSKSFGVSTDGSHSLQGCLTSGSHGSWGFALTCSSCFPTLRGTVSSSNPVEVEILAGGALGGILYSKNDTTSASFADIALYPSTGYAVYIKNLSGENNSISISLQISGS
ncbi:MAG: hypothetical protein HY247_07205 [archaeon]|nr:MAG: hypothetical protein HY247_07205 [archaeon]